MSSTVIDIWRAITTRHAITASLRIPHLFATLPPPRTGFFAVVANIPAYFTKKMYWVDVAWPLGLVIIGLLALILGDGWWIRKWAIAGAFAFQGGRMGFGSVMMVATGVWGAEDLPRYQYQKIKLEAEGGTWNDFHMQVG